MSTELPPPQTIQNKDGTKTTITYRFNEDGLKVKTTRRIRMVTHREVVNPRVAERKGWAKFGLSAKDPKGPQMDTTSVGENIIFRLSPNWRQDAKDESKDVNATAMKDKLKDKTVKCRICNGEHFTARCPFKDTMAPVGADGGADVAAGMGDDLSASGAPGGAGAKKGSYVPPALRNGGGAAAAGDRMGGKFGERDDLATLRVTNVSAIPGPGGPALADGDHPGPPPRAKERLLTDVVDRFPRWPRRASSATCSSGSAASPVCSWPRTAIREWQRALPSSATRTGRMPSRRAARWTGTVSSISFCAWSLPRSRSKKLGIRVSGRLHHPVVVNGKDHPGNMGPFVTNSFGRHAMCNGSRLCIALYDSGKRYPPSVLFTARPRGRAAYKIQAEIA